MERIPPKPKAEKIEDVDLNDLSGWKPLEVPQGEYVVYVDGCSKGNPGEAAYAFVAFAHGGVEVLRGGDALGKKTNNQAEYEGLIASLEICLKMGLLNILVVSDSELLVKQIQGLYRVKNPDLRTLWGQAKSLAHRFEKFDIRFTPRKGNAAADKLANEALRIGLKSRRGR
ncbi:MAG TPA: ribonuclease HI family protein [bacterium]|nr:ribonuclease HI family protein [bacterium]